MPIDEKINGKNSFCAWKWMTSLIGPSINKNLRMNFQMDENYKDDNR